MSEFYVTFGEQYRTEQHPSFAAAHPDGWLTIVAEDAEVARVLAGEQMGERWAFMYSQDDRPDPRMYPRGELARWWVP